MLALSESCDRCPSVGASRSGCSSAPAAFLLAAQGWQNKEIAAEVDLDRRQVALWRKLFLQGGVDARRPARQPPAEIRRSSWGVDSLNRRFGRGAVTVASRHAHRRQQDARRAAGAPVTAVHDPTGRNPARHRLTKSSASKRTPALIRPATSFGRIRGRQQPLV